jgi:NADH:ubiquinone oxidoreductase subunit 4 (subunit M)
MIAHGFSSWIVSLKSFSEDMKRGLFLKWVVFTITKFASMFLLLVLASVALPTTFNFVGEFTVYIVFLKSMFGFPSRRNNNYIGCLLYVENVPTSNVRRNKYKSIC